MLAGGRTLAGGRNLSGKNILPVAVIGGGPVGLAAAAHLHAYQQPFVVLEAGREAGAAVREWGHVRTFSPWRYMIDGAAKNLLESSGWSSPRVWTPRGYSRWPASNCDCVTHLVS